MGVRRYLVGCLALSIVIGTSVLGSSTTALAASAQHHSTRGDGGGVGTTWTATGQTLPANASATQTSSGAQALFCPAPGSCVVVGTTTTPPTRAKI